MTSIIAIDSSDKIRPIVASILRSYMIVALPFLLALVSIRLVMTPLFLQIEYTRPGFPDDYFGFTRQDRLEYAPFALQYLLNADDIDYLGDLRFPDGSSMYNARELHHMRDVKVVTQIAYLVAVFGTLAYILAALYLYRRNRYMLRQALWGGALFTFAIIAAIVIVAILNWDFFFTGFHTIFFSSGTWRFEYSDTLIRLFPEQFWFDAALVIGTITILAAGIIVIIAWIWNRKADYHV